MLRKLSEGRPERLWEWQLCPDTKERTSQHEFGHLLLSSNPWYHQGGEQGSKSMLTSRRAFINGRNRGESDPSAQCCRDKLPMGEDCMFTRPGLPSLSYCFQRREMPSPSVHMPATWRTTVRAGLQCTFSDIDNGVFPTEFKSRNLKETNKKFRNIMT